MTKVMELRNKINENGVSEDGIWQSILDIGYDEWVNHQKWSYDDMLKWMNKNYGDFATMAILIGKYNQQVCNGGHLQYFDNGYATSGGGMFNLHSEDIHLHNEMMELMEKFELNTMDELTVAVFNIMIDFNVQLDEEQYCYDHCSECGGRGTINSIDEEEEECPDCDGGEIEYENPDFNHPTNQDDWNKLDTRYYEVSDKWEDWFELFVEKTVFGK